MTRNPENKQKCYELFKQGMKPSEIAKMLRLKPNTVKAYLTQMVFNQIYPKEPRETKPEKKRQRAIHFTSSGVMFR